MPNRFESILVPQGIPEIVACDEFSALQLGYGHALALHPK
jgi:hypothetical protein